MKRLAILLAACLALGLPSAAFADTRVTSSNTSEDSEVESGDATSHNSGTAFVGQTDGNTEIDADDSDDAFGSRSSSSARGADITNNNATNVQEGDNELDAEQNANAASGDTVGGQVIGTVVDGTLVADATNLSSDVDAESGDADSDNSFGAFVGLSGASDTAIAADDDILNNNAENVLAGDNDAELSQDANAVTGDAIGGQVFGGVTTGAADIVLANTSEDADTSSGDSDEDNNSTLFTGLAASGSVAIA
jgi:hypothetical protein